MSETLIRIESCPVEITLRVIGGKYKPLLLYYLAEYRVLRFGQLRKLVSAASKKMLTQQLRELEADGIVRRKVFHQVPPKVEYSLTARGATLKPVLVEMGAWGSRNSAKISNDQRPRTRTTTRTSGEGRQQARKQTQFTRGRGSKFPPQSFSSSSSSFVLD